MTVQNPPSWLQQGSHPATHDRMILDGLLLEPISTWRGGVASNLDLKVTQTGGGNMTVTVAAGSAYIRGTSVSNQGVYHMYNDAAITVTVTAANGSQPRIDLVIARIQDADVSGATNLATIEMVNGTPAASPTPPSAPVSSIVLANVTVPAAATSVLTANIADVRPYATALGGTHWYRTTAEALTSTLHADGSLYWLDDTSRLMITKTGGDQQVWGVGFSDILSSLNAPWTSFTPTWTNTGTDPAIGNGTITGRWLQAGKFVAYSVRIAPGTTTSYGTGTGFSVGLTGLPTPVATGRRMDMGELRTATTTVAALEFGSGSNTATMRYFSVASSFTSLTSVIQGTPVSFASTSEMTFQGFYEST